MAVSMTADERTGSYSGRIILFNEAVILKGGKTNNCEEMVRHGGYTDRHR